MVSRTALFILRAAESLLYTQGLREREMQATLMYTSRAQWKNSYKLAVDDYDPQVESGCEGVVASGWGA